MLLSSQVQHQKEIPIANGIKHHKNSGKKLCIVGRVCYWGYYVSQTQWTVTREKNMEVLYGQKSDELRAKLRVMYKTKNT